MCSHVCQSVYMCTMCVQEPESVRGGIRPAGAGITESYHVGWTKVLYRSNDLYRVL